MALERTSGRDGTSGLMIAEKEEGGLRLEYVDYNVGFFGGADFEGWYDLDGENAEKLRNALNGKYPSLAGDLDAQARAAFGDGFDDRKFLDFCAEHGITAEKGAWSSFDFDAFKEFE